MIRADGDALVDVLLVVRLVDPVLELEELGVGERRDLRLRASTSPRRRGDLKRRDAGAPTLSVRFVLKLPVAKARDASRPAKKP